MTLRDKICDVMKNYLICIGALVGMIGILTACYREEQPFIVTNNAPYPVSIQIFEHQKSAYGLPTINVLPIAQKDQQFEQSMQLAWGETASIYTAGTTRFRTGYYEISVSDESGKQLFRQGFVREELIEHQFKLTIVSGVGIRYSP
ncbi:MAG: hypothetical protein PHN78_08940 [Dehalococcoidales bacterium]|nr:hypothetical protein [Dehalococcoidales bacterium]